MRSRAFPLTNSWLAERYGAGVVLFDRAIDPPRMKAGAAPERIVETIATLDEPQRIAFQRYRAYGLDLGRVSSPLRTSEAEVRMILAKASSTLLAEIGNEARPRSLRSHLCNHPRHNLDLYLRPGDFDRLLAVTFYRRAVDHTGMMSRPMSIDMTAVMACIAEVLGMIVAMLDGDRPTRWRAAQISPTEGHCASGTDAIARIAYAPWASTSRSSGSGRRTMT